LKERNPMRKWIIAALMLMFVFSIAARADESFRRTELWGSVSFGGLLSGFQLDMANQTLSPVPDSCSTFLPIIGIRSYVADPLGIEASFGFSGITKANCAGYEPLNVYDYSMSNLGLVFRYAFRLPGSRNGCAFSVGGGANYSFLSLSDAYTSLFSGFSFYNVLSDIGWYAKTSLAWYPSPGFFLDATAWYYFINAKFDVSGKQLDGYYILFAVFLGLAF